MSNTATQKFAQEQYKELLGIERQLSPKDRKRVGELTILVDAFLEKHMRRIPANEIADRLNVFCDRAFFEKNVAYIMAYQKCCLRRGYMPYIATDEKLEDIPFDSVFFQIKREIEEGKEMKLRLVINDTVYNLNGGEVCGRFRRIEKLLEQLDIGKHQKKELKRQKTAISDLEGEWALTLLFITQAVRQGEMPEEIRCHIEEGFVEMVNGA